MKEFSLFHVLLMNLFLLFRCGVATKTLRGKFDGSKYFLCLPFPLS
jgi:hypothetical protein